MKNKIEQPLKEKLIAYRFLYKVEPTTTNKSRFEKNNRAEYIINFIDSICETMDKQYSLIGKEVFKYTKSTKYVIINDYSMMTSFEKNMNKIIDVSLLMTHQAYLEYEKWHVNFLIEYLERDLLEHPIAMYSTCQLSNLIHGLILDEKQRLIKYLKSIITNE